MMAFTGLELSDNEPSPPMSWGEWLLWAFAVALVIWSAFMESNR